MIVKVSKLAGVRSYKITQLSIKQHKPAWKVQLMRKRERIVTGK